MLMADNDQNMNNNNLIQMNNNNNGDASNNNNNYLNTSSRVTNITTLEFDLSTDLSTLPDILFLFTFLDCKETHELNANMTEYFGPVVHFALTGL